MSDVPQNNSTRDTLDEELVAYLDGELEPQAAQRLENLLATDHQTRRRLSQLASSWDLLDQLPRATVDDLFTRTTVEMVAVAAEGEIEQTKVAAPAKQRRRLVIVGVATLLAAAVGFVAMGVAMPDRNDPLLRNLPVIVNLELYRSVGDVELLKKLETSNLFPSEAAEASSAATSASKTSPKAAATPPQALTSSMTKRREWIDSLSPDKKLELNHNYEQFMALSSDEKQSLLGIDDYLQSNPQQLDQLIGLMQRYHDWLKTLTPAQRADLSDATSADQHVAEIKRLKQEQESRLFARLGSGPGGTRDVDHILRWMQDFAHQHEKEILEQLPDDKRQELDKIAQRPDDRGGRRFYQRRLTWELWQPNSSVKMPEVTEADVKSLLTQLSSDKQAELQAASTSDDRVQLMRQWIRAAIAIQRTQYGSQGWRPGGGPNSDRGRRDDHRYPSGRTPQGSSRPSDDVLHDTPATHGIPGEHDTPAPNDGPSSSNTPSDRPTDEGQSQPPSPPPSLTP